MSEHVHSPQFPNSTGIDQEKYITVESAADLSGYNVQYLRRLLRARKIESIKIGQMWLIRFKSFETYLNWAGQKADKRCGAKCSQTTNCLQA